MPTVQKKKLEDIKKRFPATLDKPNELNFLNDKCIDGELYAIFQGLSMPENGKTVVQKSVIPKQVELCAKLGIKSPKTLRSHLNYLISQGYIEIMDNGNYLLPNKEDIYFMIPLPTLQYLNNNCKEHIIKIYIYLGQRYKQALNRNNGSYEFTLEEIGNQIGLKVKNNSRGYGVLNNALEMLYNAGLIDYCGYFDGVMPKKKLTKYSLEYKKNPADLTAK